jgi:hypothetical protein
MRRQQVKFVQLCDISMRGLLMPGGNTIFFSYPTTAPTTISTNYGKYTISFRISPFCAISAKKPQTLGV